MARKKAINSACNSRKLSQVVHQLVEQTESDILRVITSRLEVDCFAAYTDTFIIFKFRLLICYFFYRAVPGERSRFPMDYDPLMMKLSAERLIWKQADLPPCVD